MSDEGNPTPTANPGNGKPAEMDTQAARQHMLDKGYQLFSSEEMHSFKEREAKPYLIRAEKAEADLAAIRAEYEKLSAWKSELDNKGKSESELMAQRQREWEKSDREKEDRLTAAQKQREDLENQLKRERVQNKLSRLLVNSTNPEMAMMWAEKHIGPMLSTNEQNQLVWTDVRGVQHVGVAAENMATEWWNEDAQKSLRLGNAAGPPTAGAPSPAPSSQPKPPERNPAETQAEYYIRLEDWQRTRR